MQAINFNPYFVSDLLNRFWESHLMCILVSLLLIGLNITLSDITLPPLFLQNF